nr:MFS transporter [Kitasatospora phosalacinea]
MVFAALLLPGGHLADFAGRRRTLTVGLAGFTAACLLDYALNLSRGLPEVAVPALQGGFGALALAASLAATATDPRDPAERAGTFGVYASVTVAGTVAGLLGITLLSSYLLPLVGSVAALAALLGVRALPADAPQPTRARFSPFGALPGALGPGALAYAYEQPLRPWTVAPSVAGLVLLAVFWWQQRTTRRRILPPDVVEGRDHLGGLLVAVLAGAGFLCLLPMLVLMTYRGDDQATVATLAPPALLAAGAAVGAAVARTRLPRPGASPRALVVAGLLAAAAGTAGSIAALDNGLTFPVVSAGTAVAGLGIGLALVPVFFSAAATVVTRRAGAASGALVAALLTGQGLGSSVLSDDTPPWWAAACLLLAALPAGTMLPRRVLVPREAPVVPAPHR